MRLLTYHGTLVRHPPGGPGLLHLPLDAAGAAGVADAEMAEAEIDARLSALTLGGEAIAVEPGPAPRTVRLKVGGLYVCADPMAPELVANRTAAGGWETFLLLSDVEVALLRLAVGSAWAPGAGEAGAPARLGPAFTLTIGGQAIDLRQERPSLGRICFAPADAAAPGRGFDRTGPAPADSTLPLRPAPDFRRHLPAVDRDAFRHGGERAFPIVAPPDLFALPLLAGHEDLRFVQERFWHGRQPPLGMQQARCEVRRSGPKYVLLQRFCEGILFDEHGTYSEAGYFHTLHTCPPGLWREGHTIMLDRAALASVPRLAGPLVVVFNPHLSNYYHWLVEGMLALDVMRDHLPEGTRLLLPGTLADFRATGRSGFDHRRLLDLLGFGDIPAVEMEAPICQVDEAVWLEQYSIDQIPGQALLAFRDRIERRLGTGQPRLRRIYIERRGLRGIANADAVAAFCQEHGFTAHRLEETPDDEQIRMFQEAEFVLAPHGAGLSNLLFCAGGTKVIELSPDTEFRPFFWQIAQRLGLRHGLLPCPTDDGTFHGRMTVDVDRLRTLFTLVERAPAPQLVAV